MSERGRPTKYTEEVVARVVQAVEMGATRRLAALYGGIGLTTLYEWQNEYPEFADRIKDAEARAAIRWLAKIEAASEVSWQAAAWKLERLYPDEFGRRIIQAQHSGPEGGPIQVESSNVASLEEVLEKLSPEVLTALRSAAIELGIAAPEDAE